MQQLPNILYIVTHCPFGESFGAQLRTLQIGRMLQRIGNVTMVIASISKINKEAIKQTRKEFNLKIVTEVKSAPIVGFVERLRHEFDPLFLNTHGNIISENDTRKVLELVNSHDLTWIHTLRVANYFRKLNWDNTVLDIDDFYSQYHETAAFQATRLLQKINAKRKAWIWRRREKELLNRFGAITICSENDRNRLKESDSVFVVPNGFEDIPKIKNVVIKQRIGVVGRLDYAPNQTGVEWFIKKVWPSVRKKCPDAEFRIIGAGADKSWNNVEGVSVLGYVDDTSVEIASWAAMAVPILVGAGTRVKIAEAFSRSCPVISTSIGAFGYDVKNGHEILLENEPGDFANACIRLLESRDDRENLAKSGRSYFMSNLHWDALTPKVEKAINEVLDIN